MEYTTLGESGLEVSRICLGCMSFGSSDWRDWVLDETDAEPIIERAIDLGINFFDTANVYSDGASEEVLGNMLSGYDRDRLVIATKTNPHWSPESYPVGEEGRGLSRKAIEQDLQGSLHRLGMDSIDLYQTHRWDYQTPIAETLNTLDDAVRRGDVRYIGTSSQWAYQFSSALQTSERLGVQRFLSMQNHYNLAYREEEREMLPLCAQEGIGVIPWSPLARGFLTRPHEEFLDTARGSFEAEGHLADWVAAYGSKGGKEINERVETLANDHGVTMAQIALAWVLQKDVVDAPIVGTTSVEHLEDAVEALDIDLSTSDIEYLEAPYEPVPITGHN